MSVKEWTTNYPTSQDSTPPTTQQPALTNESSEGAGDGDATRVSQIHTLRDKLDAVAKYVGDVSSLPAGCLKAKVTALESKKLDDMSAPDDNTDLDASTSAHGLMPKLDNSATNFLNGQGAWAVPDSGADPHMHLVYRADSQSNPETGTDWVTWVNERFVIDADYVPSKWVFHVSGWADGGYSDTGQARLVMGGDSVTVSFAGGTESVQIGEIATITETGDDLIDMHVDYKSLTGYGDSIYIKYIAIYAIY